VAQKNGGSDGEGGGGGTRKARREPTSTGGRESLLLNWEIYFRLSRNEMRNISLMPLSLERGMIGDKRIPPSSPVNVLKGTGSVGER
jgi:hypothetical protein